MTSRDLRFTTTGKYLNIDQKQMAAILRYDQVRWGFEISEGDRPADALMPHKNSPTVRVIKDVSLMRRPIVIPIGSVISALPVMSQAFMAGAAAGLSLASGSFPVPVSGETTSGTLPSGMTSMAGNVALGIGHDGTMLTANIEDAIEGYGKINLVAVLANGGASVSDPYHAYDYADSTTGYGDEINRVAQNGALIDANTRFLRPANLPIGVVTQDIFLDDAGQALNFTTNSFMKFSSFLTDYYVEVPYVCYSDISSFGTFPSSGNWIGSAGVGYKSVIPLGMPILFADTRAHLVGGLGHFVKPEINGKYLLDTAGYASKTVQHIGKLTSVNNKFPADMEDLVMVVKDTGVGGTDTYGIPFRLFVLANTIYKAINSAAPTYSQLVQMIDDGVIGMARINLHVS